MSIEDRRNIARRYLHLLPLGRVRELPLSGRFSAWSSLSGEMSGAEFLDRIVVLPKIFSPPLRFSIEAITAEGEQVAVQCQSRGTLIDGRPYDNEYHYLMLFEQDRLLKVFEYMNVTKAQELFRVLQAARSPVTGGAGEVTQRF